MHTFARLLDHCARSLSRYENVVAERAVLAAVSGGIDSTVLLLALARLRDEGRLPGKLCCAHIDHGVRADSRSNAEHCVELCARLGVPVTVRRLDLLGPGPGRKASTVGVPSEDAMREARYRALQEAGRFFDAGMLVTGHHADDNLETVLFRMLRGTGPRGLAGIPEARWLGRGERPLLLVRPLLRTRRSTLVTLLEESGEVAFEDRSNRDLRFARNRLRHETIPALREHMGIGLDVALMTVASTARAANEIVEAHGLRILSQRSRHKTDWRLELDLRRLDDDATPFVREALRQAHEAMHPHGEAASTVWLDRTMALLPMADGKRVAGRGGLLAERTRRGLLLVDEGRAGSPPAADSGGGQLLPLDSGRQRFGATEWSLEAHQHPLPPLVPTPDEAGPFRALLDPRRTAEPWRMRTRRTGDRFHPLGHDGSIELRRFLQSRHVPRFDRDRLPLLVDAEDRILWIPGVEVGELARLHLNTRQCVEVLASCA